jgi:hypothetical protein
MFIHDEAIIDLFRDLHVKNKVANRDIVAKWFLERWQEVNGKIPYQPSKCLRCGKLINIPICLDCAPNAHGKTTPEPTIDELSRRYPQLDLFKEGAKNDKTAVGA